MSHMATRRGSSSGRISFQVGAKSPVDSKNSDSRSRVSLRRISGVPTASLLAALILGTKRIFLRGLRNLLDLSSEKAEACRTGVDTTAP